MQFIRKYLSPILLILIILDAALLVAVLLQAIPQFPPVNTKYTRRVSLPFTRPSLIPTPTERPSQVTVAFTGVTAISRGVEEAIERTGDPIYPAREVMGILASVDITHVNSENPFFDDCNPERHGIVLCGRTRSIASLQAIGADVIDLAGNHQNDYGFDKNLESINHLEEAGFDYFGGGKDQKDARKILYKTVNGTTFAFLGYAYFDSQNGPQYRSLAYGDRPGANYYSEEKMREDLAEAKRGADVVIVDYQFIEKYQYEPLPEQVKVFRKTADAGADVVVGVQSHQPQEVELYSSKSVNRLSGKAVPDNQTTRAPDNQRTSLIFYGLGNFFFDQMWSHPTRQGIIPIITFEDGEIIDVEIKTTLLYDYAQPRVTSGEEREELLEKILPTNWPYPF